VTTAKLADGQVTTAKIADGQVTTAKLASGAAIGNIADKSMSLAKLNRLEYTSPEVTIPPGSSRNLYASAIPSSYFNKPLIVQFYSTEPYTTIHMGGGRVEGEVHGRYSLGITDNGELHALIIKAINLTNKTVKVGGYFCFLL
jgi:hypothetical protein